MSAGRVGGLPASGTEPRELLEEAADLLFRHSLFNGHPRFFGFITSSAAPIGRIFRSAESCRCRYR